MFQYVLEYCRPEVCAILLNNFEHCELHIRLKIYEKFGWNEDTLNNVIHDGDHKCLEYLINNGMSPKYGHCGYILRNCGLECVKLIHRYGLIDENYYLERDGTYDMYKHVVNNKDTECVKYLMENGYEFDEDITYNKMAFGCFKYLYETRGYSKLPSHVVRFCASDDIEMWYQYIRERKDLVDAFVGLSGDITDLEIYDIENMEMSKLRKLYELLMDNLCTTRAFKIMNVVSTKLAEYCAEYVDVSNIVKLYEDHIEYFDRFLEFAFGRGRVEIVEKLCDSEMISDMIYQNLLGSYGHNNMYECIIRNDCVKLFKCYMKYIADNRHMNVVDTTVFVSDFAKGGAFKCVKYICENECEIERSVIISREWDLCGVMLKEEQYDMFVWLCVNFKKYKPCNIMKQSLSCNIRYAKYLHEECGIDFVDCEVNERFDMVILRDIDDEVNAIEKLEYMGCAGYVFNYGTLIDAIKCHRFECFKYLNTRWIRKPERKIMYMVLVESDRMYIDYLLQNGYKLEKNITIDIIRDVLEEFPEDFEEIIQHMHKLGCSFYNMSKKDIKLISNEIDSETDEFCMMSHYLKVHSHCDCIFDK